MVGAVREDDVMRGLGSTAETCNTGVFSIRTEPVYDVPFAFIPKPEADHSVRPS